MRLVPLLALALAPLRAAWSDQPAPPKPGSAEWRQIDAAITRYCKQHRSSACTAIVGPLHHTPRALAVESRPGDRVELHADWCMDGMPYAGVRRTPAGWVVRNNRRTSTCCSSANRCTCSCPDLHIRIAESSCRGALACR